MKMIRIEEHQAVIQQSNKIKDYLEKQPELKKLREKWHIPPKGIRSSEELIEHDRYLRDLSQELTKNKPKYSGIKVSKKLKLILSLNITPAHTLFIRDIRKLVKDYPLTDGWFSLFKAYVVYGNRVTINASKIFIGRGWDKKKGVYFVSIKVSPFLRTRDIKKYWGSDIKAFCKEVLPSKKPTALEKSFELTARTNNETGELELIIKLYTYIIYEEAIKIYRTKISPVQKRLPGYKSYLQESSKEIYRRDGFINDLLNKGNSVSEILKELDKKTKKMRMEKADLWMLDKAHIRPIRHRYLKSMLLKR